MFKNGIKILILFLLCISNSLKGQVLKYAPHSQSINGNVKEVDTYQYSPQQFDTLDVSRKEELKGKLTVKRQFDRKTGNLLRIEKYSDLGISYVDFEYDDKDNLLKSFGLHSARQLHDTVNYIYDYENLEMMRLSNRKSMMSVQGKSEEIKSIRRIFDVNGNIVGIEYLGTDDELLLFQKKYYDIYDRLLILQNFEYTAIEKTNFYTYDTLGRKKINQTVDNNGNITRKFVYSYFDNGYEFSNFGANGKLEGNHRIVQFKDKFDNVIKEYNFNLKDERTIIIEYKIEYFEE